jgi:hypothetical protein
MQEARRSSLLSSGSPADRFGLRVQRVEPPQAPGVLRSHSADQDLFPPIFQDFLPQEYPLPRSTRLGIFNQTDSLRLIAFNSPGFNPDGTFLDKTAVDTLSQTAPSDSCGIAFSRGGKRYELSNHLGNVLAVISDRKLQVLDGGMSLGRNVQ